MAQTLPQFIIEFQTQGVSAVARSEKGIVMAILKDDTKDFDFKTIKEVTDLKKTDWTTDNYDYISRIMFGSPSKIIIKRIGTTTTDYSEALKSIKGKKWNYLTIPTIEKTAVNSVVSFIKSCRAGDKKYTYKAVLPNCSADHEGIINFCTEGIKTNDSSKAFTAGEYCARIAGILAGLPFVRSSTYYKLTEVTSITESSDPNTDIGAGKLILINDNDSIKIGRGVNSLITLTATKGEDFQKIKIIEGVDLIQEDILSTWNNSYVGLYPNTYDYKVLFFTAVKAYFKELEKLSILDSNYENRIGIDIAAHKNYLMSKGINIEGMDVQEIKVCNTGSSLFATASVKFVDSMEDFQINISM